MDKLNDNLKKYIEEKIIPTYDTFDHGHDSRHAKAVISRSLEIAQFLNDPSIDINMVYTAAAFHDMGMTIARKGHAKFSYDCVIQDENLKKYFDNDEIITIAQACADHSTSTGRVPRSIYGKIVSDADKDNDISISLMRAWDFSIFNFPQYSLSQHLDGIHEQIQKRFGENGSVKFYLPAPKSQEFLKQMQTFAVNKELFEKVMKEILANEKQIEKED